MLKKLHLLITLLAFLGITPLVLAEDINENSLDPKAAVEMLQTQILKDYSTSRLDGPHPLSPVFAQALEKNPPLLEHWLQDRLTRLQKTNQPLDSSARSRLRELLEPALKKACLETADVPALGECLVVLDYLELETPELRLEFSRRLLSKKTENPVLVQTLLRFYSGKNTPLTPEMLDLWAREVPSPVWMNLSRKEMLDDRLPLVDYLLNQASSNRPAGGAPPRKPSTELPRLIAELFPVGKGGLSTKIRALEYLRGAPEVDHGLIRKQIEATRLPELVFWVHQQWPELGARVDVSRFHGPFLNPFIHRAEFLKLMRSSDPEDALTKDLTLIELKKNFGETQNPAAREQKRRDLQAILTRLLEPSTKTGSGHPFFSEMNVLNLLEIIKDQGLLKPSPGKKGSGLLLETRLARLAQVEAQQSFQPASVLLAYLDTLTNSSSVRPPGKESIAALNSLLQRSPELARLPASIIDPGFSNLNQLLKALAESRGTRTQEFQEFIKHLLKLNHPVLRWLWEEEKREGFKGPWESIPFLDELAATLSKYWPSWNEELRGSIRSAFAEAPHFPYFLFQKNTALWKQLGLRLDPEDQAAIETRLADLRKKPRVVGSPEWKWLDKKEREFQEWTQPSCPGLFQKVPKGGGHLQRFSGNWLYEAKYDYS